MVRQLLLIEVVAKLATGLSLLLAPGLTIRMAGLPLPPEYFWVRLLGAALVGIASAVFIGGQWPGASGLGLAGCVAINLSLAAGIGTQMAQADPPAAWRGRILLAVVLGLLFTISLVEIAYASTG